MFSEEWNDSDPVRFILVGPMIKKLGVVKTLLVSFAMGQEQILLLFTKDIFIATHCSEVLQHLQPLPMMCLVGVMTAMSIDYNEYKYGVRMVAISTVHPAGGKGEADSEHLSSLVPCGSRL